MAVYDLPQLTNRSVSTSTPQVLPGMSDIYNQLLGLSTQNYANVANMYAQGQNNLEARLPLINTEFEKTLADARNGLRAAYAPAARDIQSGLAEQQGELQSSLTSAGLGNTTKGANLSNQLLDLANRSRERVAGQIGQQDSGLIANLGSQRLAAMMQGLGMMSNLTSQFGGILGGYHFPTMPGPLFGQTSQSVSAPQHYGGGYAGGGGVSGSPSGGGGGGIGGLMNTLGGLGGGLGLGGGGSGMGNSYGYAGPSAVQAGYGNFNPYYGSGMLGQGGYGMDPLGSETNPNFWNGLGALGTVDNSTGEAFTD